MFKHVTSLLVAFCFFTNVNHAQCPPAGEPVPGDACTDAQTVCNLDGYCYTLSFNNIVQPFPGCGSGFVLNNDEWISFIAGTPELTIEIVPANCLGLNGSSANNGMQAAIYGGDCTNLIPVVNQCPCMLTPFTLSATNLVPGQLYYFVADGCAGDICEYTIHILQGSVETGMGGTLAIKPQTVGVCEGQTGNCESACSFSQSVYTVDTALPVEWTVTGAESFDVQGNTLTVIWGEPGLGEITVSPQGSGCLDDGYLCIDILPTPTADFATLPATTGNVLEICQGQTVAFENLSEGAVNYVWDFGNGQYAGEANPSFTFDEPGLFTIALIAQNECACTDTSDLKINVLAAQSPEIECVATTCQGDVATYTTSADCSSFTWTLDGEGVIIDGGGTTDDFMTVEWTGDEGGIIGLAVSGCTSDICLLPTEIEAPILNDQIPITGPDNVCPGETVVYTINRFDGSDKEWTVSNLATIVEGQGTSTLVVEWDEDIPINFPQQWVRVKVTNCWLDCEGVGHKDVKVNPELSVKGDIEVCENTQAVFYSQAWPDIANIPCNWTIKNELGIPIWSSTQADDSVFVDIDFAGGRYSMEAVPANPATVCSENYILYFNVVDAPPMPLDILGPREVCPGEWVTYSVASAAAGSNFLWEVENGLDIVEMSGHTINVQWDAIPIYNLTVRQVSEGSLGCLSGPFTLAINPLAGIYVEGEDVLCAGETGNYEAIADEVETFEWEVIPPSMGTVISGQGTPSVHVFWEMEGTAVLQTTYCGIFQAFNVTVNAGGDLDISHPIGICEGEMGTVEVLDSLNYIVWQNTSGSVIGNGPVIDVGAGNYLITAVDQNGCKVHEVIEIEEYFEPTASISIPTYMPLCPGGPGATIVALQNESGLTFEWFHNGQSIGNNSPTLWTNEPGLYEVVVTNPGGCGAVSNEVELVTCESVGGVCENGQCVLPADCATDANLAFDYTYTGNCNEVQFQNFSTGFVPGSLSWTFGDPASGPANVSTEFNPTHIYPGAGNYTAWLFGIGASTNIPGGFCQLAEAENIEIPALADFEVTVGCFGTPTQFTSKSAFLPNFNVIGWAWDFGDPNSGWQNTSNLQHPTHVYNEPGSYTVSLTITMSTGCQVTSVQFVAVPGVPPVDFTTEAFACAGTAVPFNADLPLSAADVEWDFGDPASGASNVSVFEDTYHAFSSSGTYDVTLTMTTIAGCTNTATHTVQVSGNNLGGSITGVPSGAVCLGDSITLSAPPGGASFEWSSGETTANIDVWFTGIFNVTVTDAKWLYLLAAGLSDAGTPRSDW